MCTCAIATACFFAILTAPGASLAAPGDLITSFDSDGILTENPSGSSDQIYDMAVDVTGIYLSGAYTSAGNSDEWRIEKRDPTSGALIAAFDGDGIITHSPPLSGSSDIAYDITIDSNYLYVAGGDFSPGNLQWRIEKRKLSDGALCTAAACGTAFDGDGIINNDNPTTGLDGPFDIAVGGNYLYIVGYDNNGNCPGSCNDQWRIEKRRSDSGALCTAAACGTQFGTNGVVTNNPTNNNENPNAVAVDVTGNYIYIAGFEATSGQGLRIEKRRSDTGALCTAAACGTAFDTDGIVQLNDPLALITYSATGIAVDAQYMYVIGWSADAFSLNWIVQKRNLGDGALVTPASSASLTTGPSSIVIDSTAMYIAGTANNNWRIEKRDLSDLSLIAGFTDGGGPGGVALSNPSGSPEGAKTIALDTSGIYVAGYDHALGNDQWRIEKRQATGAGARGGTYVDCGVRINTGGAAVALGCEPVGTLTSQLRIYKTGAPGAWRGVGLVPANDPNGSKLRIQTPSGVRALREY